MGDRLLTKNGSRMRTLIQQGSKNGSTGKNHHNSRSAFNVGVKYNSILDDEDNIDNEEDDLEEFDSVFTRSSIKLTPDNTSITTSFHDQDTPEVPPKPKRRRVIKKALPTIKAGLSTSVLPDSFRSVFHFDEFNKMQSEAFPNLYESDKNCVISSPTGSGKTVLFELAILRLIMESGQAVGNTKILYVAPTKSLCCERLKNWGPNFLNLSVGMLTSDTSYLETEKVKKCNIIITTPEKWDLLTRKWSDYSRLFELVKLILVDEIHTLKERRGATLEVVLTRMNIMCEKIRIVAVSATIPNVEDISVWLTPRGAREPAQVLTFGDSYRQVALQKRVYGYSFYNKNEFQYDNLYNSKLEEVIKMHGKQRPVLIFCPTRSSTVSTAKYIVQHCLHLLQGLNNGIQEQLNDQGLSECFYRGVAFHHAGLSISDRTSVEQGFLQGRIKVLCSTSTLAVGVNLPAYLVVIKGTRIWNASMVQEYSQLDVLQMIGRAGRPGFETEGCAVIMTDAKMKQAYENMLHGTENLESFLHLELTEHLSAEISLGTITSTESAVNWLRNTFFYVRFKRNPAAYSDITKFMKRTGVEDSQLIQFCESILKNLLRYQVVQNRDGGLVCTPYGHAMARHYILFESMINFINAKSPQSMQDILCLLSGSKEFTDIRVRHNEKRLYKEINLSPLLKYPFLTERKQSQIIDTTSQKVSLLIQYELGGLEFPSYQGASKLHQTLVQDKSLVLRNCFRILKCMVDTFIEKKDGISLKNTLFMLRSVNGNCWEDSAMVLRQLKSIGLVSVRKLVHHDVHSLEKLGQLSDQQIEYYLGQKMGAGAKIRRDLTLLPQLQLRCKLENCSLQDRQVVITLKVELSAQFETIIWHGQALSLDIETLKTTGELLDFRRIKLAHLSSPRSFRISTTLGLKSDCVEIVINCLEVASIGKRILFSGEDLPHKFHHALPSGSRQNTLDKCLFQHDSDADLEETSLSSDDSLFQYLTNHSAKVDPAKQDGGAGNRTLKSNGNFECNHTCKDKNRCRHLCCKEGIPRELLRTKRAPSVQQPAPSLPAQPHESITSNELINSFDRSPLEEFSPIQLPTRQLDPPNLAHYSVVSPPNRTALPAPSSLPASAVLPTPATLHRSFAPSAPSAPSSSSSSSSAAHQSRLSFLGSDVELS